MSTYTPPVLNAVDFALNPHTVPSIASPQQVLSSHTVPALNAVDFALVAYTPPTYMDVGWELLPSGGIAYTLVCNVGAYTYSGQSAELTVARNLALSAGAYNYAGSDATLDYVPGTPTVNYTLDCLVGNYVYAGNNAILTYQPGSTSTDIETGVKGKKRKYQSIKLREIEFKESTADYINRVLAERQAKEIIAKARNPVNIPLIEKPKSNEEAMKILIAIAELI